MKVSYQVKVDGAIQTVKSTKFTLKNTTVGKHTFAVRTVLTAGDGKENHSTWSSVSADVGDVTVPKLGRLTASVDGYTGTITLDASDNGAVDHYVVTLGGITKNVAGTKESVSFDDLAIGKHTAAVQAFDAAGNASKVKKVKLTVKDATPPETVTGFNAVSAAKGKAILSWDAVNDNSGKPVAYEVELNGKIIKSRKTTCSVKLPDGDHSYRVRAVDKAKNVGAWSAVQEFSIATDAKSAAIALSYCDTLRLNSALQAADASFLTPSAVKEQAFLAAL